MNSCGWKPSLVKLHDGREVLSDSEEWKRECQLRAYLNLSRLQQQNFIEGAPDDSGARRGGMVQRQGKAAADKFRAEARALWESSRSTI